MYRDPDNILVLRLGGIGEVLAVSSALRALRSRFERAWITLLAEDPACEMARGLVNEVVRANAPYRATGLGSLFDPGFYAQSAQLVARVLRRRYDLFLDFHHAFAWRHRVKPFLASLVSRAPRRVGFGDAFFLTDAVPDPDDRPMFERTRGILSALGIPLDSAKPTLSVDPSDQEWVDTLFEALQLSGSRIIAVSPGSSRPLTRWGIDRFRETVQRLSGRGPVVAVGTGEERPLAAALGERVINLAGRTTVGRLAGLLRRCALLVSNDSGPLHMACALGTPVVGIFRPQERRRWGAYDDPLRFRALSREGPGAEEGRTLANISVPEVVGAAEELLDANTPRS